MRSGISKTVWILIVGNGFAKMASIMSLPFLAIFLSSSKHLNGIQVGSIIAASPIAALFGAFLGGQASDIFGRKNILIGSVFALMFSFFGFYGAAGLTGGVPQLLGFIFINSLSGFFSSMFQPVSQALMADLTTPNLRPKAFQLRYAAVNIGAAVGPALGGLAGFSATPKAFLVTGFCFGAYGILLAFITHGMPLNFEVKRRITFKSATRALAQDSRLRHLIFAGAIFMGCYVQVESNLSRALAKDLPNGVQVFALLLSLNGLAVILLQAPLFWFIQKTTPARSMILGTTIFAFGELAIAASHGGLTSLVLGIILISCGEIFVFPVGAQYIDEIAPDHLRGTYFGASQLRQVGLCIGPALGGFILDHAGMGTLFFVSSCFALLSAFIHFYGQSVYTLKGTPS